MTVSTPAAISELTLLFDGDCPLCAREVRWLMRRDEGRGRVTFVDIAAPGFDAALYGTTQQTLMARIHGVLPDGTLIEGIDVFQRLYSVLGPRFLGVALGWRWARPIFDALYRVFARNRLRWTGRSACDADRCAVATD